MDNSSAPDPKTTEESPSKINSPIITRPIILGDLTLASPTTLATIGSNGTATALTANPVGYLVFNIGNVSYQIPYFNLA